MIDAAARLSPRQRECLRLVWERRTSKEIAVELGIGASTVDGYIKAAIETLEARDRREAAAMVFGAGAAAPPENLGPQSPGVPETPASPIAPAVSTKTPLWPQPNRARQFNTLTFAQTLGRIGIIAIGSMAALALAMALGSGLPPLARPLLKTFDRLTQ